MKIYLLLFIVFLIPLVVAGNYDDCTIYGNCKSVKQKDTVSVNYTIVNTNSSEDTKKKNHSNEKIENYINSNMFIS